MPTLYSTLSFWSTYPRASFTARGSFSPRRNRMGCRNSAHDHWKAKMAAMITAVCTRGNMIEKKIWKRPAPSMRADSSKESGMVEKYWRNRKIRNGAPCIPNSSHSQRLSVSPILVIIRYSGTTVTM